MDVQFLAATKPQASASWLGREISRILTGLGVSPSRKGHGLLRDAVLCDLMHYRGGVRGVSLYRAVAACHNCSEKACESGMRNALKSAHRSGLLLRLNGLLGTAVIDQTYTPPNLEFIALVAQYCYYRFVETE